MFPMGMLTNHIQLQTNAFNMNLYPNTLTPPMDSPPTEMSSSPIYLYDSYEIPTGYTNSFGPLPSLKILEQPVDRFRFRYKSEMSGTHGSLCGLTSDRSRKQTYPCVQLLNYNEPAVIRCSLYQYGRENTAYSRQLHAHRLVKKQGAEEIDDPHEIVVNSDSGYIANFHSMGIIHTAKKFIIPELIRKNTRLKKEEIARADGELRPLTKKEDIDIRSLAEKESKCINLNVVCLRFDAYKVYNSVYYPLCEPVYTHAINNLKSALTGDLKIVRMDHCSSSCRGGREVFILVEKVTKKNIKVRFFELDEEDREIWSDYGRFSDLDVHHQFAIVFKTPPYKNTDIDKQVRVYIELQRPSDGARSEAKDFVYTPCDIALGKKRTRYDSNDYSTSQLTPEELPLTLNSISSNYVAPQVLLYNPEVNGEELEAALKQNNIDSAEFDKLCNSLIGTDSVRELFSAENLTTRDLKNLGLVMDTPSELAKFSKMEINSEKRESVEEMTIEDTNLITRVEAELTAFMKTHPSNERISVMLRNIVENYLTPGNNNVLHVMAANNNIEINFRKKFVLLIYQHDLLGLFNCKNQNGQTPLHIAADTYNDAFIKLLIKAEVDRLIPNRQGNTAVHIAVLRNAPSSTLQALLIRSDTDVDIINHYNFSGFTPLQLAVTINNFEATKILCQNNAAVNHFRMKDGYTPLHIAVENSNLEIVKFLIGHDDILCDVVDFKNMVALKLAHQNIRMENPVTVEIYDVIKHAMEANETFDELFLADDDDESEQYFCQL
ncbi:hypothetical protein FQA39_LY13666 [Lamprigera yunnana]|nr:hypothetical protein FQA39_LY13666 [Lamprigera yunnana]